MSQDTRLYGLPQVWDQPLQKGQRNLLQAMLDFWPVGIDSALDVGCGDGKLGSQLIASTHVALVGLDSSEEALSRLPFSAVKGVAQALPFADGAFDLAMSTDALEHMPEPQESAAWGELFRVASKAVLVAVPFREELLDATACCGQCGYHYHVNWHERSYDIEALHRRVPKGWQVRCTILSGEPWSAMLPPETQLRRRALGQWSGWEAALCPVCGTQGEAAVQPEPLPPLLAEALGGLLYPALAERRYCRSHSEILVLYQRDDHALALPVAPPAKQYTLAATGVDLCRYTGAANLQPYCQTAGYVRVGDHLRLQFPLYEVQPRLMVRRLAGSEGALHLMLEDAAGCLLDEQVLDDGEACACIDLPRAPVAGYYGVLASLPANEPFAEVRLGEGPDVLWLAPSDGRTGYLPLAAAHGPLFVQVSEPLWFDPAVLECGTPPIVPSPGEVLHRLERSGLSDMPSLLGQDQQRP
ncbi:class I SAM-dependent methyltransferase [Pseudomonas xanthosomatis]|uniref:class I SAM-dependent methyltransferase n=1 Tax=Pseudomonas xanthosomatis TaxID=2842356 RepID=UPI0035113EEE